MSTPNPLGALQESPDLIGGVAFHAPPMAQGSFPHFQGAAYRAWIGPSGLIVPARGWP